MTWRLEHLGVLVVLYLMPTDSTGYCTHRQAEETQSVCTGDFVPIDKIPEPGHVHEIHWLTLLQ